MHYHINAGKLASHADFKTFIKLLSAKADQIQVSVYWSGVIKKKLLAGNFCSNFNQLYRLNKRRTHPGYLSLKVVNLLNNIQQAKICPV